MKKRVILIAILLFISNLNIFSQTYEPSQKEVTKGTNTHYMIDSESNDFKQTRPIVGWMWGSKALISNALFATQNDVTSEDKFKYIPKNAILVVKSTTYGGMYCDHGRGENLLLARAMNYKTTLKIPALNINYDSIANACNGDNNNSIFGWGYINPLTTTNGNSLILDKTNFKN